MRHVQRALLLVAAEGQVLLAHHGNVLLLELLGHGLRRGQYAVDVGRLAGWRPLQVVIFSQILGFCTNKRPLLLDLADGGLGETLGEAAGFEDGGEAGEGEVLAVDAAVHFNNSWIVDQLLARGETELRPLA